MTLKHQLLTNRDLKNIIAENPEYLVGQTVEFLKASRNDMLETNEVINSLPGVLTVGMKTTVRNGAVAFGQVFKVLGEQYSVSPKTLDEFLAYTTMQRYFNITTSSDNQDETPAYIQKIAAFIQKMQREK